MNQSNILVEWLPDKNSFKYIDRAVVSPQPVEAMGEEREIRVGWMTHPQVGIGSGQRMIDVGARYGEYTLTALALGCDHVYAFEKNRDLVQLLRESLHANGSRFAEKCSVLNKTISPITQTIDNYIFEECSVIPRNIKWIVIDVGGQDEMNILEGCYKTIMYYKPISILIHHYDIKGPRMMSEFLLSNAFDNRMVMIQHHSDDFISTTTIF